MTQNAQMTTFLYLKFVVEYSSTGTHVHHVPKSRINICFFRFVDLFTCVCASFQLHDNRTNINRDFH